jgi:hypothetical protein
MKNQTSANKRKVFLAIFLIMVGFLGFLILYARSNRMDRLIDRELYAIAIAITEYITANSELYPLTLDFLDEEEYQESLADTLEDDSFHIVELSRVRYVWPGEEPYNSAHPVIHRQERVDCMKTLYGDFGFAVDIMPLPTRKGMPINHQILLTYEKKSTWGRKWTYVNFMGRIHMRKYPSEDVNKMIVLQNAYFRLPVDISDADILREAVNDEESSFRFRSAEVLAKLGIPEGRQFLEETFKSSDIFQKTKAADGLARLGDDDARAFLNDVYKTTDNGCLKKFVETAIGEILTDRAKLELPVNEADINFLLKGLEHPYPKFRFGCAETLTRLGRPEGREFLDRQFENNDTYLKFHAADVLARLGDKEASRYMQEAVKGKGSGLEL